MALLLSRWGARAAQGVGADRAASSQTAPGGTHGAKQGAGARADWTSIDYRALVDGRRLGHSGESVAMLLQRLEGRPVPPPGERPDDATSHVLLDPLLEPFAFVLSDALDSLAPAASLVEVGSLWQPGEAQPAWAELLRARSFVVESDGKGRLRVCLPWRTSSDGGSTPERPSLPSTGSEEAGREAWERAWPVLRHVVAAERRRLDRRSGAGPDGTPIEVDVHPFVHEPSRSLFRLGLTPYHLAVADTRGGSDHASLDLVAWQGFFDRGLQLEGGRLEPDGTVRLLGSDVPSRPTVLGRPVTLSDVAVAYRAVFHGGLGEPYMSLDRGDSPQTSLVNYGGRLQDTSLGLVSLLCDIRFKTFSLGIDVLGNKDMREAVRRELPGFRTHNERFAADARSKGVLTQQTRLWFYPDAVDLTLSSESDVLVMRRVRMSAASERVQQETFTAAREADPPWTLETVAAINRDYDVLGRFFPELADLDQVVRLLSFFTWLRGAGAQGLDIPDLDALLALELPAEPTPRRFPQLLAYNTLPLAGESGPVQVYNRLSVGEALDRLLPGSGVPLPARRRLQRALSALDRRQRDQAALAQELEGYDPASLDESSLDLLAYRAERLRMHTLVLNTLPPKALEEVQQRKAAGEVRTISVGIGGLDLGMSQALARAAGRNQKTEGATVPGGEDADRAFSPGSAPRPSGRPRQGVAAKDSTLLPPIELPEHGLAPESAARDRRAGGEPLGGQASGMKAASESIYRTHRISKGVWGEGPTKVVWIQTVMGADGPAPRARRLILGPGGAARTIERLDDGRFLRYRIESGASGLRAVPQVEGLPPEALSLTTGHRVGTFGTDANASDQEAVELPPGLTTLTIERPDRADPSGSARDPGTGSPGAARVGEVESSVVTLRVRGAGGREMSAPVPRPILQRLVLGREADLTPDRPLPGLSPAEKILGPSRTLMLLMEREQVLPPWSVATAPLAGEDDPPRLAFALGRWWSFEAGDGFRPAAVAGTDAKLSPARWRSVSGVGSRITLVLPNDAFPGLSHGLKDRIAGAWKGEISPSIPLAPSAPSAPSASTASLVVLVSAEDPALLGARLREAAAQTAMKGRLLAVWPLGGPVRPDLPASLLAEGNLAALGMAAYSPITSGRIVDEIAALSSALADPRSRETRPEHLPTPLLWYY